MAGAKTFYDIPLPYSSTKPLPTRQATRGTSLKRGKTLTRPERHVVPAPLIAPPHADYDTGTIGDPRSGWNWWVIWSYATTFWAPPALLKLFGIKEKQSRQAWREKMTLCWIAIMMGAVVGFATMGLQRALCPQGENGNAMFKRLGEDPNTLSISGWVFNISNARNQGNIDFHQYSKDLPGMDITALFTRQATQYPECSSSARYASTPLCNPTIISGSCALGGLNDTTYSQLQIQNTTLLQGYSWDQVAALKNYIVLDGMVLNMGSYLDANPQPISGDGVDWAIRHTIANQSSSGKDATMLFHRRQTGQEAIKCLQSRYLAGRIDKITPGCFVANLFLYASLAIILGVVFVRFVMACIFNWFISSRLIKPPKDLGRTGISPAIMPEGANMSVHNRTGTAPWAETKKANKLGKSKSSLVLGNGGGAPEPLISLARIGTELFTICLVTCYSEGEDSVRGTVESIAATNYSDSRKLLWLVCDGMITGQGEKMSTPDICVSMLDADPRFGNPMPMGYIAVGSGAKRENRAMVYAGHYVSKNGHRTPTIIVVKCGMPSEAKDKKPGNRGKRDSQLVLMNFFSRVTYNDRMSPLDFDIFRKVQTLMGVTPDYFEVVLMVSRRGIHVKADSRLTPIQRSIPTR
jgi:chitin synthase